MCKTCKGKGGIAIDNGFFYEYRPCPDTNCDFEYDDSDIKRLKAELDKMEEIA